MGSHAAEPGESGDGVAGPDDIAVAGSVDKDEADTAGDPAESAGSGATPAASRWQQVLDRRTPKKKRPLWVEIPILILTAVLLTFVIQTFIAKVYYIPSGSMEQTLHGATTGGDRVLVNKILYDFTDPAPGDVVVFRGPPSWPQENIVAKPTTWYGKALQGLGSIVGLAPPDEKDFVKRVIATGGQTVLCCDAAGSVTVDGKALVEPYIYQDFDFQPGVLDCTTPNKSRRCFPGETVPAGMLWVMGDHRSDSADSRAHGVIGVDDVIGKAAFVVAPISRWQSIGDPDIQQGNGP
ncbi:signal peptidase I [Nakamurella silvestris]|nr:signal peptidase I [Nakamurella silvestris]